MSEDGRLLSLEVERLRVHRLWRDSQASSVPLALAASLTLHEVHRGTDAPIEERDYVRALDIAASALSRLIPVYTLGNAGQVRVPLQINFARQQFSGGATELRYEDGTTVTQLSVERPDVLSAIPLIQRTFSRVGFAFLLPDQA